MTLVLETQAVKGAGLDLLKSVDWAFVKSDTSYSTHDFHPYPAKFIPQIPQTLIEALSKTGDTVLDPFCGSGTALVESLLLGRNAIGVDLNPLAVLITKAKTTPLSSQQIVRITKFLDALKQDFSNVYKASTDKTCPRYDPPAPLPLIPKLDFWFDSIAIREAAVMKRRIDEMSDEVLRNFLAVAFSSILVSISRQDSDTRYVRRQKNLRPLDAFRRFQARVHHMAERIAEFSKIPNLPKALVYHRDSRDLSFLKPASVHLVVTSPPYPNAYSYHLYHQYRMLWLGMDPWAFKKDEIGSHRKYSKKANGATADTFAAEMQQCFDGLHRVLVERGRFCLVIGDSILRGQLIDNSQLLRRVAEVSGFQFEAEFERPIDLRRKSFNPKIGKIRHEHILVFKRV